MKTFAKISMVGYWESLKICLVTDRPDKVSVFACYYGCQLSRCCMPVVQRRMDKASRQTQFLSGGKKDLVLGTSEQYCFPKHVWSIKVFLVVVSQ